MKFLAGILVAFLALPALASERMTAVTIDGTPYVHIQEVHISPGARIVIMYDIGGITVTPDKVSKKFLESWGITTADLAASRAEAEKDAEQNLAKAVHDGVFREVDGVIYDMRKPQSGWRYFADASVLKVIDGGALVDPTPYQATTTMIFVRHLPSTLADNQKISFKARMTGDYTYANRFGYEQLMRAYDVGRVCKRNEIPDSIIKGGLASATLPGAHPKAAENMETPGRTAGDYHDLRAIGSGFFITRDGYLLTNFHVVRGAHKVEVKYKNAILPAKIIEKDEGNDLALLKVPGNEFMPLAISRREAELGDAVFTIGFPNIQMQGVEPKYTDGKISSVFGMQDDASEYQISVPVQPGNSGGPLCDNNGEVVGIVVARLNDLAALRESGAVPQNVNYAVKAKFALQLAESVRDVNGLLDPAAAGSKPEKPIHAVEDAIVMIRIY